MVLAAFCRACGSDSTDRQVSCTRCGTALHPPDKGSDRIGRMVEVKGRIGHRNGLGIAESAGTVQVLLKGEARVPMPAAEFDACKPVAVGGPAMRGAAGRIWLAAMQVNAGAVRGSLSHEITWSAAMTQATATLGARRAAAIDAIALGIDGALGHLGLSASELLWYRALAAAAAGHTEMLVACLEQLPAAGYAERVRLLMGRAGDLLADYALGERAAALLGPFTGTVQDARALRAALAPVPRSELVDLLVPFAELAGAGEQSADIAASIAGLRPTAQAIPADLASVRALSIYLRGRSGTSVDAEGDSVAALPVPLIDELIDQHSISPALAGRIPWRAADAAYLHCRLDPARATDEEIEAAGFAAEIARRRFIAAHRAPALDDLPAGDPAVRHYRALAAWRETGVLPAEPGLRPAARTVLAAIDALGSGPAGDVPEEIAADPSAWPYIRDCAAGGGLRLPAGLRQKYPRFGDWLDLCALQDLVFAASWQDVVARGRELAQRSADQPTRDEALNAVAFAEHQLGRTGAALQTLDGLLRGPHATGILVNASVVATATGSLAAIAYLARIVGEAPGPAVERAAIRRAYDLWADDATSPEYPDALRGLIRTALAKPQPDDFHRWLLSQADSYDAAWLAQGPPRKAELVRAADRGQADALSYYRSWARSKTDGYDTDLADVAKVLVAITKAPGSVAWAQTEKKRFVEQLNDAIHCPFGEAIGLAPAIEVLLAEGGLDTVRSLVFAAQAGAHIACYLAEHDGEIAPQVERRLIFDTVARFNASAASLSPDDLQYAGDEVARCVTAAANAMGVVAQEVFDRRGAEWDDLVRREQRDYQNRPAILRAQRAVLDDLAGYVGRVRAYLSCMGQVPLNDVGREMQAKLTRIVSDWSDEVARLRRFV